MRQHRARRWLARLASMVGGGVAALAPMSASAHFGITGTADLIIDYGLLTIIGILVVGGAAVSAWLAAGSPNEEEDEDGEVADWEHGEAVSTDALDLPPTHSTHPTAPAAASDHNAQSR